VKLQQAWPAAPQAVHVPFVQPAPLAVQNGIDPAAPSVAPPQQAWPTAPHGAPPAVEQLPLLQVPETPVPVQASPEPTHLDAAPVTDTQQPPPLQLFPAQQGWPDSPQAAAPPPPPAAVVPPVAWPPVALLPPLPPVPPFDLLLLQAAPSRPRTTTKTAFLARTKLWRVTLSSLVDSGDPSIELLLPRRLSNLAVGLP